MKNQDGFVRYIVFGIIFFITFNIISHQISKQTFMSNVRVLVSRIVVPGDITLIDTECTSGNPGDEGSGSCIFSYITDLSGPAAIAAFSTALQSAGYNRDTTKLTPLYFNGPSGKLFGNVGYYKGLSAPIRLKVSLTP
jgi:hypothetical protein